MLTYGSRWPSVKRASGLVTRRRTGDPEAPEHSSRENYRVSAPVAMRICIVGEVSDLRLREDVRSRARRLGLCGWVCLMEDGGLCAHTEGDRSAIQRLVSHLRSVPEVDSVSYSPGQVEGHEGALAGKQLSTSAAPSGVSADLSVPLWSPNLPTSLDTEPIT